MIIEKVKLKDIKPSKYNPRIISPEQLNALKDSMEKFGNVQPLIINKKTGNLVSGHQRLKVLNTTMHQDDEVECVIVDLDEFQEKALNIACNKISGEFEDKSLAELLKNIQDNNADLLKFTGFKENEINQLLQVILDEGKSVIEDYYKEQDNCIIVNKGDVWQLGNHRLYCGASEDIHSFEVLMGGGES